MPRAPRERPSSAATIPWTRRSGSLAIDASRGVVCNDAYNGHNRPRGRRIPSPNIPVVVCTMAQGPAVRAGARGYIKVADLSGPVQSSVADRSARKETANMAKGTEKKGGTNKPKLTAKEKKQKKKDKAEGKKRPNSPIA